MIGTAFGDWINSYRSADGNQPMGERVQAGKRKPCRSCALPSSFWQEGHTAHADEEDARRRTMRMLQVYKEVIEGLLAVPVYEGQKTPQNVLQVRWIPTS